MKANDYAKMKPGFGNNHGRPSLDGPLPAHVPSLSNETLMEVCNILLCPKMLLLCLVVVESNKNVIFLRVYGMRHILFKKTTGWI